VITDPVLLNPQLQFTAIWLLSLQFCVALRSFPGRSSSLLWKRQCLKRVFRF